MFKLVIQDDEGKTTVVPLIRDEITIGRKEGNTIRLTERNVSRRHARILRNNGEVQIEDLGSYNGIRVNNARIAERVSLRVSDQVQIGDYKLYLKAEGVEQVDDARTMPMERVDSQMNTAPTDVIPAVASTPTQPMGVPTTPVPGRLIGDPNRTLVSVADTDPQGRPVASAAQVAAMSATAGYGKLVVLSSNFAGKEFELSRPQMIIGRTDENDIVVNHRSISRNHAKLVREPETGRYTISDLQSSNGVRVNGQDYGKVELRRGDVVDLGHVRLRFVEPGEDFVFARDAVITDVPDLGGRRSALFVVLGLVVLAAVAAVIFWIRSNGNTPEGEAGSGSTVQQGSQIEGSNGSNGSATQVALAEDAMVAPPPVEIDAPGVAAVGSNPKPGPDLGDQRKLCLEFETKEKWDDMLDCGRSYANAGGRDADEFIKRANVEIAAGPRIRELDATLDPKVLDIKGAKTALDQIQKSKFYPRYKQKYEAAEGALVDRYVPQLKQKAGRSDNCKEWGLLYRQIGEGHGRAIAELVKARARCQPTTPQVDRCEKDPNAAGCPGATVTPPPPACDAAASKAQGIEQFSNGNDSAALKEFDKALACKAEPDTGMRAFMASCRLRNLEKAKYYWKRFKTASQPALVVCVRNGIQQVDLEGP
jgi:pSer/pThr/pTyr-binding forkhead associated (FHA) protein